MKKIGILGGMNWRSTAVYYQLINEEVRRRLGGQHSAQIVIESIDFSELTTRQEVEDWEGIEQMLLQAASRLQTAGADFWLMACNTVHRVSDALESQIEIPFLHIGDPAGQVLVDAGIGCLGLLGTSHTMQGQFYPDRLRRKFEIETVTPSQAVQAEVHGLIMDELNQGIVSPGGRKILNEASAGLCGRGAGAILLACTELGLLYDEAELGLGATSNAPIFDTAALHALAAVDLALEG